MSKYWQDLLDEIVPGAGTWTVPEEALAEVVRLRREIESLRADCYQTVIDPRGHEDLTPDGAAHHVALDCFARLTRILEGGNNA